MIDLRVTVAVDVLQVRRMASAGTPGYIRLIGPNLGTASEVRLNSLVTTDIVVVSENQIDVALPEALFRVPIRDIEVKSLDFTGRAVASLSFELDVNAPTVEGLAKLVQNFLCLLQQTPGSDAFHQDEGGGLHSILGKSVNKDARSTSARRGRSCSPRRADAPQSNGHESASSRAPTRRDHHGYPVRTRHRVHRHRVELDVDGRAYGCGQVRRSFLSYMTPQLLVE